MSLASTIRAAAPHTPQSVAQAFNSRSNSIGFLRWLMAFMVIFSHAGPIAGFYGGEDLGVQISKEQSIGGVAVAGFFFFSGFLITRSRMGRATIWRYMWRRVLRIFPAYWAALLFTVAILAPIAYWHTFHNISGYLHPATESPLTYFVNNMWLNLGQRNIAGMGENLPYFILHGARDWNGSAWTLIYEFKAYILVAILGLFGALANRKVGGAFALVLIALNALQWMGAGQVSNVNYLLRDPFMLMFMGPFAFGMLFTLYGDKIPMDSRLAWGGLIFGVLSYASGGWNIVGQYGFLYFLMYLAIRLPLQNWEKHGDLSYGIYIYAWPIMAFAAYFHLQDRGWIAYHLTVVVTVHILAYLSWHLIEKPAMSQTNYLPGPRPGSRRSWRPKRRPPAPRRRASERQEGCRPVQGIRLGPARRFLRRGRARGLVEASPPLRAPRGSPRGRLRCHRRGHVVQGHPPGTTGSRSGCPGIVLRAHHAPVPSRGLCAHPARRRGPVDARRRGHRGIPAHRCRPGLVRTEHDGRDHVRGGP